MPVTRETLQGGLNTKLTFQCHCAENSYLRISKGYDGEYYVSIDIAPTRLKERIKLAWQALRGMEFSASNEVVLTRFQMIRLGKELKVLNKGKDFKE